MNGKSAKQTAVIQIGAARVITESRKLHTFKGLVFSVPLGGSGEGGGGGGEEGGRDRFFVRFFRPLPLATLIFI